MPCEKCTDLDGKQRSTMAEQREAEEALAKATTDMERDAALLAVAKARRRTMRAQRRLQEHRREGC